MIGGFQATGFAFQPLPAFQQEALGTDVEQPSGGGWIWRDRYDQERARRSRLRKKQKELEAETERIKNDLDRQIAQILRDNEAKAERGAELARLKALATELEASEARQVYGERVAKALERATIQGNYSAVEALDRELSRAIEEEQFLLLATQIILNEG